jgi:hypothetical protein
VDVSKRTPPTTTLKRKLVVGNSALHQYVKEFLISQRRNGFSIYSISFQISCKLFSNSSKFLQKKKKKVPVPKASSFGMSSTGMPSFWKDKHLFKLTL